MKKAIILGAFLLFDVLIIAIPSIAQSATGNADATLYREPYRPQIHFSPKEKWMNDPNGMVYHKGTYHLFYQYYPDSTVWGPMHWGHATSTNLINWTHQPIALYPDSLGYIFSGSAVVDHNNTSGFGKGGRAPLVAIFTHHDPAGEKAGRNDYQVQSLAYSLDDGKTWTKYADNPVVKNPGLKDFRDPKVMWYEEGKKWIMALATYSQILFYSSKDLKSWTKESEFGKDIGAHGGVWECPDLFPLEHNGKKVWVLIVNLNPGGPNGGSATQYFLGNFDGKAFTASHTDTRWLDYGPDEYAGVTWSNTGDRKIFLGWMSNWLYGQVVPTKKWRSAMTLPRDLLLKEDGGKLFVASWPSEELRVITSKPIEYQNLIVQTRLPLRTKGESLIVPARIDLNLDTLSSMAVVFSNEAGEELVVGYNRDSNQYYIDRSRSGDTSFHQAFATPSVAPRLSSSSKMTMTLLLDVSSVELFADDGLSVMTGIFFPSMPYTNISLQAKEQGTVKRLAYSRLRSIWK
jgi:fructan beta-fructosidase